MPETKMNNTHKADRSKLLLWCAVAFASAAVVSLIAAAVKGLFPFGDQKIYYSDLTTEYATFLTELWRKVHSGGSLFYSWKTALGGNFWGNLFYYTASPLNLFVLLVKESAIDETIAVLIYLRRALAAVFMCVFLCRRRGGRASFAGALCGVLYGNCGWLCGFYQVTILQDTAALLPLLLFGVERIIDKRRPALYFAVLTVMLFSNFYMSYFAAFFAVLYWFYYFFTYYRFSEFSEAEDGPKKVSFFKTRFFTSGILFVVASLLSVLCLSVVLLPVLLQLLRNEANYDVGSVASYFSNITQQLSALFSGAEFETVEFRNYPAIYTGVLALVAAPLYFAAKNVSRREKVTGAVLLGFMVLSFNLPFLDYAWHGFRYPTNNPFREAFLFSAVVVVMVWRVLAGIKETPPKAFFALAGSAGVVALVSVIELLFRGETVAVGVVDVVVTAFLFLVFAGTLLLLRFGKKEQTAAAVVFLFVFTVADGAYTFASNIHLEWTQTLSENEAGITGIVEKENDDDLFFRTEMAMAWVINDGSYFDFNGIGQSSSLTATSTLRFLKEFGADSNLSNLVRCDMQTPVFNSVLGVRYLIEQASYAERIAASYVSCAGESYRIAETAAGYSLYRFGDALSLGFAADRALSGWQAQSLDAAGNQSSFYALAAGSDENVFVYCDEDAVISPASETGKVEDRGEHIYHVEASAENNDDQLPGASVEITAQTAGRVYVYCEVADGSFATLAVKAENQEGTKSASFSSISTSFCGAVYEAEKVEPLKISCYTKRPCDLRIRVFQVDDAVLARQHEAITKGGELALTEFSDTRFSGTVDVAQDNRMLCVTVPFDPGWRVTVDGEALSKGDYTLIGDVFYGIPLEKGAHTVTFDYRLPGFAAGAAVTCCAVLMAAAFFLVLRKKRLSPEMENP